MAWLTSDQVHAPYASNPYIRTRNGRTRRSRFDCITPITDESGGTPPRTAPPGSFRFRARARARARCEIVASLSTRSPPRAQPPFDFFKKWMLSLSSPKGPPQTPLLPCFGVQTRKIRCFCNMSCEDVLVGVSSRGQRGGTQYLFCPRQHTRSQPAGATPSRKDKERAGSGRGIGESGEV